MSAENKPGYDTLVYFWFAIVLYGIGAIAMPISLTLQANGALSLNAYGLTVVDLVGIGSFAVAGIFSLVVAHKCIAMLIHLVHRAR